VKSRKKRLRLREHVAQDTAEKLSLAVHWAFVVQFRTETDMERGQFEGRVEHVVSGQATPFHSLEEGRRLG